MSGVDYSALKAGLDDLCTTVNAFKKENAERLAQIEAKGSADPLLEQKVNKLNDEWSNLEARINRLQIGTAETDRDTPEAKAFREAAMAFFHPKSKQDAMQPAEFTMSFDRGDSIRALQTGLRAGKSLPEIKAAQGVGSTGAGLALVAPEFSQRLEQAMLFYGGMMQEAEIFTTDSGVALPWPTINDTGNVGAILSENGTITPQDATFAQTTLNAYKYTSKLIAVSWELLQDSFFDVESLVANLAGQRVGRILNTHFTVGTGSSQPNGIVTAATTGKTGLTGQTLTVIYDDLVDLVYSIDPAYRPGSTWMMNDASIKIVRKLKDSQGRPLWGDFNNPLAQSYVPSLLGYRLVTNNDVPVMAANAKSILFGDITRYKIRRVRDMQLVRLNERYADNLQTGFFVFARFDGNLIDAGTHPVKLYVNSAT